MLGGLAPCVAACGWTCWAKRADERVSSGLRSWVRPSRDSSAPSRNAKVPRRASERVALAAPMSSASGGVAVSVTPHPSNPGTPSTDSHVRLERGENGTNDPGQVVPRGESRGSLNTLGQSTVTLVEPGPGSHGGGRTTGSPVVIVAPRPASQTRSSAGKPSPCRSSSSPSSPSCRV